MNKTEMQRVIQVVDNHIMRVPGSSKTDIDRIHCGNDYFVALLTANCYSGHCLTLVIGVFWMQLLYLHSAKEDS